MTALQDEVIVSKYRTTSGRQFRCSRRTEAHLDKTYAELKRRHPKATLYIVQGCFNTTVAASAGTHDYDAVIDFRIVGLSWSAGQQFLRELGWAAWWRHTGLWRLVGRWHHHAVSIGYRIRVGVYVPGQVEDYYAHRSGLAGHVPDPTWHPRDIDATKFDFALWERQMEDDMPYTDWPEKDRKALVDDVVAGVREMPIHSAGERQLSAVLAQIFNTLTKGTKR